MSRIFICYRRDDASGHAGRLRDALSAQFGAAAIFRDMEAIGPGDDFVEAMSAAIESCPVFLAVIGRQWLSSPAPGGTRRLDDELDHVRSEIAEALKRGVRVIPVLVQNATMPRAEDLPVPLAPLATRNAIALDDDSWETDVQRLGAAIRQALRPPSGTGAAQRDAASTMAPSIRIPVASLNRRHIFAAGALVLVLALVLWFQWDREQEGTTDATAPPAVSTATASRSAPEPTSGPTGSMGSPPSSPQSPVTLPAGGEAELGETVIEVIEAGVAGNGGASQLVLKVRLTNRGRYDTGLDGSQFRLVLDGDARAPTSAPVGELVATETSKEATIVFALPPGTERADLQISGGGERAQMALDFTARTGLTPSRDRDARRAGSTTFAVAIDDAARQMRFGELVCELRAATVRRYVNKLTLTLSLRADNGGRYDTTFGDGHFRLLLDGNAIAPVSGLSEIVRAQATRDGQIQFDLPLETTRATLRGRYGDLTATIPLELASRSRS